MPGSQAQQSTHHSLGARPVATQQQSVTRRGLPSIVHAFVHGVKLLITMYVEYVYIAYNNNCERITRSASAYIESTFWSLSTPFSTLIVLRNASVDKQYFLTSRVVSLQHYVVILLPSATATRHTHMLRLGTQVAKRKNTNTHANIHASDNRRILNARGYR